MGEPGSSFRRGARGPRVSRRAVVRGGTLTALTASVLGESALRAAAAPAPSAVGGAAPVLLTGTPQSPLALPILGNGINLDQPQYYETLQAGGRQVGHTRTTGDIDGDGSDELLVRASGGILAWSFDPSTGQWLDLLGNPPLWSDAAGWAQEACYATIQTADVDGDGRAELLARGPAGLEVWRYDPAAANLVDRWVQLPGASGEELLDDKTWAKPEYYRTMMCADIDGDGRDELMVRGPDGMLVWRLEGSDADGWSWTPLPGISDVSDAGDWYHPMYYETLQCAHLTDPQRAVVVGRGADALLVWSFDGSAWSSTAVPENTELSNANGWDAPASYYPIQCADVDGDGLDELLGLGDDGLRLWRVDSTGWHDLATLTDLSGAAGWRSPDYYSTIQCADLDGDGRAEVLARGSAGVRVWRFTGDPGSGVGAWAPGPDGPEWSDTLGWNQHEYYATIQTARVAGGSSGSGGTDPQRVLLIGRTSTGIDTWQLDSGTWSRTTAAWPEISPTIMMSVSEQLGIGSGPQGPRTQYNNTNQTEWEDKADDLATYVKPADVDAADWQAAIAQLQNEFTWVGSVQTYYKTIQAFVQSVNSQDFIGLVSLAGEIQISTEVQSSTSFVLDVISLFADTAASLLGFNAILQKAEKVVSGIESLSATVGSIMLTASEGTEYSDESGTATISGTLTDLESQLAMAWSAASTRAFHVPGEITGGWNGDNVYVPGDYGMLAAIGSMVHAGVLPQWRLTDDGLAAGQTGTIQGYTEHIWKVLEPKAQWAWSLYLERFYEKTGYDDYLDNTWYWWPYRGERHDQRDDVCYQYFPMEYYTSAGVHKSRLVPTDLLGKLLGPRSIEPSTSTGPDDHNSSNAGNIFPLGVDVEDVMRARNGWSKLGNTDTYWLTGWPAVDYPCGQYLSPAPYHLSVPATVENPDASGAALAGPLAGAAASATGSSTPGKGNRNGKSTGKGSDKGDNGQGRGQNNGKGGDDERTRPVTPPPPTRKGPDLDVTPFLTRLADGSLEVTIEVTNRGSAGVTNVEITDVMLQGKRPDRYLPTVRTRIDKGKTMTRHVRLAAGAGTSGQHAMLHVTLGYVGGSEHEGIDVQLP